MDRLGIASELMCPMCSRAVPDSHAMRVLSNTYRERLARWRTAADAEQVAREWQLSLVGRLVAWILLPFSALQSMSSLSEVYKMCMYYSAKAPKRYHGSHFCFGRWLVTGKFAWLKLFVIGSIIDYILGANVASSHAAAAMIDWLAQYPGPAQVVWVLGWLYAFETMILGGIAAAASLGFAALTTTHSLVSMPFKAAWELLMPIAAPYTAAVTTGACNATLALLYGGG
ncbi:uncharacterized protein AMSG_07145 [Thecamonas trahens ATCC 50062]|uniref:Uncharacterized protein n=1 Tax=Thecamonas trahens ATCC 50062 TaxID=461836 RepID=A0A0L0DFH1_THETB|nr:hypothetical protein AMSG_07145 [Thecamonas trahens ATCC 50062]KNC50906.1 hypothetical protein AMSG_07145 [Thecamonas trahens ATCC 50062]|eukprot:XP_013756608.1 hypothetical protein AMSG_07145 [Thecamonas trahens ATCC 50062]